MPGYLEIDMKRGSRLSKCFIEANSIRVFFAPDGGNADTVASPDTPMMIATSAGDTIETFGTSVGELMLRISQVKLALKHGIVKGEGHIMVETAISWSDGSISGT